MSIIFLSYNILAKEYIKTPERHSNYATDVIACDQGHYYFFKPYFVYVL